MRRAVQILALAACGLAVCRSGPAGAQANKPQRINAIGLIDFGAKPTFKVGDYVRYRMNAKSALGVVDDYTLTVLIAGEEQWWGEDCFWLESWTDAQGTSSQLVASLMSYDVFRDSLALKHMQMYVRKTINEFNPDGTPLQTVYKRPASSLKSRDPVGSQFRLLVDTLGTETITVPKGTFKCTKIRFLQGRGATGGSIDSTEYTELREVRTTFLSPEVPITHIAREDIEQSFTRKAWKVGRSKEATPTLTLDRTLGSAELIESGHGLAARMVPERLQKSLEHQRAESQKPKPTPKAATPKKSG